MLQAKIKFLSFVFLFLFVLLSLRLGYWQVIEGPVLASKAKGQYKSSSILTAPRGNILASDGSFWVTRKDVWIPYINPQKFEGSVGAVAEKLKDILENDQAKIESLLTRKESVWVPLGRAVDYETKKKIEALDIESLGFEPSEGRGYPEASIAAQLLGFVGKDDDGGSIGYFGLEGYYNLALSGKAGFIGKEVNAAGSPIILGKTQEVDMVPGVDLVTSIDKRIQILISKKLKEGIEKYGAKAGSVIVMEPSSGQILGMESYPSYDPRDYWEYNDSLFKNPIISDSFEPGSIFKVLIMAAGLDAGVIDQDTKCDICSGPLKVDKYIIETWNKEYYSDSSMTDVIVHSDNVGMAFVGQKLGTDKLYDYLNSFGIGRLTGIDLQGEATPSLRKKGTWSVVDLATATFGQGVAVTPIQMIRAVGAIANNGVMVTPRVIKKIKGESWENATPENKGEQVISSEASAKITAMMAEASKNGESKWTSLRGFKVAGKTGTAQIPIAGHYDAEKTNASFIGFAPYDEPKFIMLVVLSEPQSSQWASETAAPLWYSIAKDLFPYLGIMPEN